MSRRLILALVAIAAIALVVGPAFAAVQNVKVSGDDEIMPLLRNQFNLQKHNRKNNETGILNFLRLRVDADLTDNVGVTVRLLNERVWGIEDNAATPATTDQANTDIALDLAYVTLKEFLYSPLTLTLGRQELHMGSEMIVGDPDMNNAVSTASGLSGIAADLSKRKSFDAMRATFDYSPLVIDAIYAKINEKTISIQNDTTLMGVDANYALKDKWNSMLEGYLYQKLIQKKAFGVSSGAQVQPNKNDTVNVIGGRVVSQPIENLGVSLEAAYQFGDRNPNTAGAVMQKRRAWAGEASTTYTFSKVRYTPTLTLAVAYFSGEPNNEATKKTYKQWDPMYENQTPGEIANALLNQTNIKLVGLATTAKFTDDISGKLAYNAYWWAKRYTTDGGAGTDTSTITTARANEVYVKNRRSFVGQELDAYLTYDYTEDVQFGLTAGAFLPGGMFTKVAGVQTNAIASQVLGSMKVAF
jgi:hypothetical protein